MSKMKTVDSSYVASMYKSMSLLSVMRRLWYIGEREIDVQVTRGMRKWTEMKLRACTSRSHSLVEKETE